MSQEIPGYSFGDPALPRSEVTLAEFALLKQTVGFTEQDETYLRLAGEVVSDQTEQIVDHWRNGIIAGIPNLARHSRDLGGSALPEYLSRSNLRFRQWILDTCLRPYDQQWLDYQREIALRHTSAKKNQTDQVSSTDHVPLRDVLGFLAVLNETIRPFLAAKGHSDEDVQGMHVAWQKSLQLQMALWTRLYMGLKSAIKEW